MTRALETYQIQYFLVHFFGYQLVIDGLHGVRTENAIRDFRIKQGLGNGSLDAQLRKFIKEYENWQISNVPVIDYSGIDKVKIAHVLPETKYLKRLYPKVQIYLHHTAGGSVEGALQHWKTTKQKVSTHYIIDKDGTLYEVVSPYFSCYHLGIRERLAIKPDLISIGIELVAWGGLKKKGNDYYAWPNNYSSQKIREQDVYTLTTPFRGFTYYDNYTVAQLDTLFKLLRILMHRFHIKMTMGYSPNSFEYLERVMYKLPSGVYSHSNVRKDKQDVFPHYGLINMLNNLK